MESNEKQADQSDKQIVTSDGLENASIDSDCILSSATSWGEIDVITTNLHRTHEVDKDHTSQCNLPPGIQLEINTKIEVVNSGENTEISDDQNDKEVDEILSTLNCNDNIKEGNDCKTISTMDPNHAKENFSPIVNQSKNREPSNNLPSPLPSPVEQLYYKRTINGSDTFTPANIMVANDTLTASYTPPTVSYAPPPSSYLPHPSPYSQHPNVYPVHVANGFPTPPASNVTPFAEPRPYYASHPPQHSPQHPPQHPLQHPPQHPPQEHPQSYYHPQYATPHYDSTHYNSVYRQQDTLLPPPQQFRGDIEDNYVDSTSPHAHATGPHAHATGPRAPTTCPIRSISTQASGITINDHPHYALQYTSPVPLQSFALANDTAAVADNAEPSLSHAHREAVGHAPLASPAVSDTAETSTSACLSTNCNATDGKASDSRHCANHAQNGAPAKPATNHAHPPTTASPQTSLPTRYPLLIPAVDDRIAPQSFSLVTRTPPPGRVQPHSSRPHGSSQFQSHGSSHYPVTKNQVHSEPHNLPRNHPHNRLPDSHAVNPYTANLATPKHRPAHCDPQQPLTSSQSPPMNHAHSFPPHTPHQTYSPIDNHSKYHSSPTPSPAHLSSTSRSPVSRSCEVKGAPLDVDQPYNFSADARTSIARSPPHALTSSDHSSDISSDLSHSPVHSPVQDGTPKRFDKRRSLRGTDSEPEGLKQGTPLYGRPAWWGESANNTDPGNHSNRECQQNCNSSLVNPQDLTQQMNNRAVQNADGSHNSPESDQPKVQEDDGDKKLADNEPTNQKETCSPVMTSTTFTVDFTSGHNDKEHCGETSKPLNMYLPKKLRKSVKERENNLEMIKSARIEKARIVSENRRGSICDSNGTTSPTSTTGATYIRSGTVSPGHSPTSTRPVSGYSGKMGQSTTPPSSGKRVSPTLNPMCLSNRLNDLNETRTARKSGAAETPSMPNMRNKDGEEKAADCKHQNNFNIRKRILDVVNRESKITSPQKNSKASSVKKNVYIHKMDMFERDYLNSTKKNEGKTKSEICNNMPVDLSSTSQLSDDSSLSDTGTYVKKSKSNSENLKESRKNIDEIFNVPNNYESDPDLEIDKILLKSESSDENSIPSKSSPPKSYTKSPRSLSPGVHEQPTPSLILNSSTVPSKVVQSKFTSSTSLTLSSPSTHHDSSSTGSSYYREKAKMNVLSQSTIGDPLSPRNSPPESPTVSSINATLLYELLCAKSTHGANAGGTGATTCPAATAKPTSATDNVAVIVGDCRRSYTPQSTPQLARRKLPGHVAGAASRLSGGGSRATSDTDDSETAYARLTSSSSARRGQQQRRRVGVELPSTAPTTPTPSRRRPTVARANRTLELRKARLSRESKDGGNNDTDKEPSSTTATQSSMSKAASSYLRRGNSTSVAKNSSSRASSRESNNRSIASTGGAKGTTAGGGGGGAVAPSNAKDPSLNRRDGGRFSMRLTGTKKPPLEASSPTTRRRSGTGMGVSTGTVASQSAVKAARSTLARSRSHTEQSPSCASSLDASSSSAANTSAANSWRRRKTYDPRKAVNEAKVQQRQARQRRPSDASSAANSDAESRSFNRDAETSSFNRDDNDALSERIKELSSTVTHDILALTLDAQNTDDEDESSLPSKPISLKSVHCSMINLLSRTSKLSNHSRGNDIEVKNSNTSDSILLKDLQSCTCDINSHLDVIENKMVVPPSHPSPITLVTGNTSTTSSRRSRPYSHYSPITKI